MIAYLIPQIHNIKGKVDMTYAFDPTGKSLQNQIIGETKPISLSQGRTRLYLIPLKGPYYSDSLTIKYTPVAGPERILVESIDYNPSFQFVDATRKVNAPVYAGISFIDLTLNGTVTYNYQAVGTAYQTTSAAIQAIETTGTNDPLFTVWDTVVTLPEVPVVTHPWSVVNVDDVARSVEELAKIGLVAHLRPRFLPAPGEEVFIPTPEEIGLGNLPNYPAATQQVAIEGIDTESLMTPATTKAAVEAELTRQLSEIGYLVALPYAGSLFITNPRATIEYQGETYAIKDESVPYTTTGVWAQDSAYFELIKYAEREKWVRTNIEITGDEPIIDGLGSVLEVVVEHDSRISPQLIINDVLYLIHTVDFKLSDDKLYINYPLNIGDRILLLTKRSLMSVNRDKQVNKVFVLTNNNNTFDVSDVVVDVDNLRITLNDFIILTTEQNDYSITDGMMTVNYRLAAGDILEVENIDSSSIFGKSFLRSLLLG